MAEMSPFYLPKIRHLCILNMAWESHPCLPRLARMTSRSPVEATQSMKAFFGIILKTRSLLTVVVIAPLALLLILYAQSRYGRSQESAARTALSAPVEAQHKQDEGDQIRTSIVRRLLDRLEVLDDVSSEEKKELEKILREADRYLAEAATKKSAATSNRFAQDGAGNSKGLASARKQETALPQRGKSALLQGRTAQMKEPSSTEPSSEAQTASIRALLRLLDEVIEDEVADTTERSQQKDALRESLLEADKVLRQYLGNSSRARIEAANRKPPIPNVYNPRRKPASEPANN